MLELSYKPIVRGRTSFHRLFISQAFASAQAFILATTATNVDEEALVRNFDLASPKQNFRVLPLELT